MSSVPKTVLGESGLSDSVLDDSALAEAAIGLPSGAPSALARPRISQRVRAWLLTALLFLVPLVAYWPATFHQYGLRDDYSNLREAHEEVGKVLQFCASAARPIYGWLLQATYGTDQFGAESAVAALGRGAASRRHIPGELPRLARARLVDRHQPVFCGAARFGAVRTNHCRMGDRLAVCGDRTARDRRIFHRGRAHCSWICAPASGVRWDNGRVASGLMVVSALIYQPSALFYRGAAGRRPDRAAPAHAWRKRRAGLGVASRIRGRHAGTGVLHDVTAVRRARVRQVRANRLRDALGRENRLVPAGAAAERPEPVRAE